MKKYVFLTTSIRNVGGAQLYISRKLDYLKENGWDVDVFFYNDGKVVIPNLECFKDNCVNELSCNFNWISKSKKKKICTKVIDLRFDQIILESHTVELSLWGEFFAQYAQCRHISYLLSEQFPKIDSYRERLFHFKLQNNLLFGITKRSIYFFLGEQEKTKGCFLPAIGCASNNVEDINDHRLNGLIRADYNILSLGRLEKPYINNMIENVKEFAKLHLDKTINLLLIGDSASEEITSKVLENIRSSQNINCIFWGYTFPIPRKVFDYVDVSIGTAGCTTLTKNEGIPTIAIDGNDYDAIGVLGYTTNNCLFRNEHEPRIKIIDLLKDILESKNYSRKKRDNYKIEKLDYSSHQAIIDSKFKFVPYDMKMRKSMKDWLLFVVIYVFGLNFINRLRNVIKVLR